MHGHGIHTWPDGQRYEGLYVNNEKHWYGVTTYKIGHTYEGHYENGKKHGRGVETYDGEKKKGIWNQGKKHGMFEFTDSKGNTAVKEYIYDIE